tara:strand:- start:873 stop:1265 length:393 start_codon:yes stop_codon:yes gene_type:complete
MDYTITELTDGNAVVTFADGSWANIAVLATDTKAVFETRVKAFAPKTGLSNPAWIAADQTGSVVQEDYVTPPEVDLSDHENAERDALPAWMQARIDAYGDPTSQLEYITENGLAAWQEEVAAIKLANPIV